MNPIRRVPLGLGYEVRRNVERTEHDAHRIPIRRRVEDRLSEAAPSLITLLSARHWMIRMTRRDLQRSDPRLGPGGVLIVDDYAWQGVRQAVDRYNGEHAPRLLLSRIDYAGRITVRLEPRGVRV